MLKFSNRILKIIAAFCGLFTVLTIISTIISGINGYFSYLSGGSIYKYIWVYSTIILGGISISLGLILIFKLVDKLSNKYLNISAVILIALFGAGCFTVIALFPTVPMTDSFYLNDTAISLAKGDITQLDGSGVYFERYSNNNMMVYLLFLIYKVSMLLGLTDMLTVGRIANASMLLTAQILFFLGVKKVTNKKTTGVKYLVVSLLYPTIMLMSSWVYTATFCIPFIAGVIFFGACAFRTDSKVKMAVFASLSGLLTGIGYFLRPIVLIVGIAYFICLVLWVLKDKKRLIKSALIMGCGVILLATSFGVCKLIDHHYYTGSKMQFPISHWVAMGLQGNGKYNDEMVRRTYKIGSTEKAHQQSMKTIKDTLKDYSVKGLVSHQVLKHFTMWGDGTQLYNIRISGCNYACNISSYFVGYKNEYLNTYCQMFWLAIQILVMVYVVTFIKNKQNKLTVVFALALIGAYIFYAIWEVKPVYAVPFLPLFMAVAVLGGESIQNKFGVKKPSKNLVSGIAVSIVAILTVANILLGFHYLTQNKASCEKPVLTVTSTHNDYLKKTVKKNRPIVQYFYAEKEFNTLQVKIGFRSKQYKNCKYTMTLYDSKDGVLAKKSFDGIKKKARKQFAKLKLKKSYIPQGKEQFKLVIDGKGDNDNLSFGYSDGINIDTIEGDFLVKGKVHQGDLWLCVSQRMYKSFMSVPSFVVMTVVLVALEIIIFVFTFKNSKRKSIAKLFAFYEK